MFLLTLETRQGCPFLPLLLNTVLELTAIIISQEKEYKKSSLEKKKSLFTDDMIIYIENPMESIFF